MAEPLQFLIKSAFDATGITAATNSINRVDRQIQTVSRTVVKFMGLFAAGGIGASIFMWGKKAVDAYAEEERAINMMGKALVNLGITRESSRQELVDYSLQLSKTIKATQEEILAAQTSLIQRGLYGEELKKATLASANLATKTGSLKEAADKIGLAWQGNTRGLNLLGIQLDANIPKTEVYAEVMRQVNKTFGGAAQEEMNNTAGKIELVKRRFDELMETLGGVLAGPAVGIIGWFEDLAVVAESAFSAMGVGQTKSESLKKELEDINKLLADQMGFLERVAKGYGALSYVSTKVFEERKQKIEAELVKINNTASGGSISPNRPVGAIVESDADRMNLQKKAEIEARRIAENARKKAYALQEIDDFYLSERGKSYEKFFGKTKMAASRSYASQGGDAEAMKNRQSRILASLEKQYESSAHKFSGAFKQAMIETEASLFDFSSGFTSAINSAVGPAQKAVQDFFSMTSSGFLNIGNLAEDLFKSILNSFYSMITQMIAKYLIFKMVTGMGLGGGVLGKFLGFAEGGPIPGPDGAPMPVIAHGGEFVLSANVVKAIKAGQPTSNISGALASSAAGVGGTTITQNINVSGGGNVDEMCRKIAEAARKGMVSAVDMSRVAYKVGAKHSAEAAL